MVKSINFGQACKCFQQAPRERTWVRWSFWVDWLLKPASYGANMNHTRTYWCNKGRSSLRILWCNSSAVFSYRPRLCQRLRPNTPLLFLSCRSYASLRCWEMCLVCTLTTHTQTHTDTLVVTRGEKQRHWGVSLPRHWNTHSHKCPTVPHSFIIWEQCSYGAIEWTEWLFVKLQRFKETSQICVLRVGLHVESVQKKATPSD